MPGAALDIGGDIAGLTIDLGLAAWVMLLLPSAQWLFGILAAMAALLTMPSHLPNDILSRSVVDGCYCAYSTAPASPVFPYLVKNSQLPVYRARVHR